MDGTQGAGAPINMERLNFVRSIVQQTIQFVNDVYIPDIIAIGGFYKAWQYGGGISSQNLMAYGDIPDRANDYGVGNLLMPSGAIINGKLEEIHEVDVRDPEQVQEFVPHSWYKYPEGTKGLHPWDGMTVPDYNPEGANFKGTRSSIINLDENAKYSWVKAPRWRGHAMEVGPLARYVIGYMQGNEYIKDQVDGLLRALDLPLAAVFSTLGRTATRALESKWAAEQQLYFLDKLIANIKSGDSSTANTEKFDPSTWPKEAKGVGFAEAPRGALGHWIKIKDTKIENYQCVVPSTWNSTPRDAQGNIGAFEAALMNTKVEVADEPVEILRTLHSFDPCMACATHVISPDGEKIADVKVR
jgi:hydrogenase large subunit